jgi:hypothetical protein
MSTSVTFFRVKRNGIVKPFLRLYSRPGATGVSTVKTSASKPAARARDELVGERAVRPHVELEPERAARLGGQPLQGRHRPRSHRERDAEGRRRARERDLALVPRQSGRAGRRDDDRHGLLPAEERDFLAAPGDVHQHARDEPDAFEGGAVMTHRDVVVVAAVHELEEPVRQSLARGLAEVVGAVEAERAVLHFNAGS